MERCRCVSLKHMMFRASLPIRALVGWLLPEPTCQYEWGSRVWALGLPWWPSSCSGLWRAWEGRHWAGWTHARVGHGGPGAGASGLTLSPPGEDQGRCWRLAQARDSRSGQASPGRPSWWGILEQSPGRARPLWVLRAREGAVSPFSHPPGVCGHSSPHCADGGTEAQDAGDPLMAASPSLSFSLGTQRLKRVHRGLSSGLW